MSRGVADFRILPGMRPTTPATDFAAPLSGPHDALIARAKSLELDTPYVPPPGDPLEHHAAGFAKVMCSAVFVTGLDPDFAAEHVGYFTAPVRGARQGSASRWSIARTSACASRCPTASAHGAFYLGDQGCITLPVGQAASSFTPVRGEDEAARRARPRRGRWAMRCRRRPLPAASTWPGWARRVDAAFEPPAAMTAAFVVT